MGIDPVLKVLFYGWPASEICLGIFTRTRKSGGKLRDRGSMLILWGTITASIFAAEWMSSQTARTLLPGAAWLNWFILFLMVSGLMVRWVAILSLGKAFSVNVAIRDTQNLKRSGLYHFARHPSYTGMMLMFLALGLAQNSWWACLCLLLPVTAALLYRIHVEEIALNEAFGAEYASYSQQTRRLIPGIY
jgi:protein-S-isoprenylcysteine O-methyltransferase Ste14